MSTTATSAMLTVAELSAEWQVSTDHIRGLIRSGQLAAINIAQSPGAKRPQWRIRREDVDQFFRQRAAVSTSNDKPRRRSKRATRQWV